MEEKQGQTRRRGKAITQEDMAFIIKNWYTLSTREIAEKIGTSPMRVTKIAKLLNSKYVDETGNPVCGKKDFRGRNLELVVDEHAQALGLKPKPASATSKGGVKT